MFRPSAVIIAALLLSFSGATFAAAVPEDGQEPAPLATYSPSDTLAHPASREAFAAWLDVVTEPRFMTALASVALQPGGHPKRLAKAIDPAAVRNWAEFTDPLLCLRRVLAGSDPALQRAIMGNVTDPDKMPRWLEAGTRAVFPVNWFNAMAVGLGKVESADETAAWKRLPANDAAGPAGLRYRY